jgi:hypothetical protein
MTQVARYGHMLNVTVTKMTMRVSARREAGSGQTRIGERQEPPERKTAQLKQASRSRWRTDVRLDLHRFGQRVECRVVVDDAQNL